MGDPYSNRSIATRILSLPGEWVMLDVDLASHYGVTVKRLNEQVRRNPERFPATFMFQLSSQEWQGMLPQTAATSQRRRRLDRLPLAFTEHGCVMLSNVLKSARSAIDRPANAWMGVSVEDQRRTRGAAPSSMLPAGAVVRYPFARHALCDTSR